MQYMISLGFLAVVAPEVGCWRAAHQNKDLPVF